MPRASQMASSFRKEIEGLRSVGNSRVSGLDVQHRLLESVFLNGVTEFESFLERVFFAAVSRDIRPGTTSPIVGLHDPQTARGLVLRPYESYLTWLPIAKTIERAEQYLSGGVPFDRLGSRQSVKQRLSVALAVRNAVAHKGDSARTKFRSATAGNYTTPGEYLAARSGTTTMCDAFLLDFARFGYALCVSDSQVARLLGPEGPFPAGRKVPSGSYECRGCGTKYELLEGERLFCPICDPACNACGRSHSGRAQFTPMPK
jgi:hypothetical protein